MGNTPGAKLKPLTAKMTVEEMLSTGRTFGDLQKEGAVWNIETAAKKSGFSGWYLRELCAGKKIRHFMRNGRQYFFYPADVLALFKDVKPTRCLLR
ncbi:MAG: hypothetical protein KGJ13_02355 [Patescibacteria group bacterium]|nr:hypothetical protein [Patescibacteria group bacterium]